MISTDLSKLRMHSYNVFGNDIHVLINVRAQYMPWTYILPDECFFNFGNRKKVIGRQVNWIGYACFYVYVASNCSLIGWWLTSDILKKKLKSQLKLVFYVIWLVVLFIEQPSYISVMKLYSATKYYITEWTSVYTCPKVVSKLLRRVSLLNHQTT